MNLIAVKAKIVNRLNITNDDDSVCPEIQEVNGNLIDGLDDSYPKLFIYRGHDNLYVVCEFTTGRPLLHPKTDRITLDETLSQCLAMLEENDGEMKRIAKGIVENESWGYPINE